MKIFEIETTFLNFNISTRFFLRWAAMLSSILFFNACGVITGGVGQEAAVLPALQPRVSELEFVASAELKKDTPVLNYKSSITVGNYLPGVSSKTSRGYGVQLNIEGYSK